MIGNIITRDAGDAIRCMNGGNPIIRKNNIYDNNGFGLNNLDASLIIDAQDNWWGDASGHGGTGPGSAEEISGSVDFSNWAASPIALIAYAALDTLFIPVGRTDSTSCVLHNWENLEDIVDVTLTDSLRWLLEIGTFPLALKDNLGADTTLHIVVPRDIPAGTKNKVWIEAVSHSDLDWNDADSFLVVVYNASLMRIAVSPDSITLHPGDSQQFAAGGIDSMGQEIQVSVFWTATGGTIDSTGLYIAGMEVGDYYVIATNKTSQLQDTALVRIEASSGVSGELLPKDFALYQNFPNPFNLETTIRYAVKEPSRVMMKIFDLRGREVKILVDAEQPVGHYSVRFDADELTSGVYFYRIQMKYTVNGSGRDFTAVKKMVLLE